MAPGARGSCDALGCGSPRVRFAMVGGNRVDGETRVQFWQCQKSRARFEAHIGDEVTITSIIGRRHTGVLDCVNPSYSHSFGNTVPELLTIGTTHEPITFHGQEDQS